MSTVLVSFCTVPANVPTNIRERLMAVPSALGLAMTPGDAASRIAILRHSKRVPFPLFRAFRQSRGPIVATILANSLQLGPEQCKKRVAVNTPSATVRKRRSKLRQSDDAGAKAVLSGAPANH